MAKAKRMRLPNGFGQISEIHNSRLRKPFRAMVTVGKSETGRPICKLLKPEAYFRTYNEAYAALIKYNEHPYDISQTLTTNEVFERWYKEKAATMESRAAKEDIRRTWKYCSAVYSIPIRDVRAWHVKDCMDNGEANIKHKMQKANPITQRKIKTVFNQLFDYALSYDWVEKNYARNLKLPENITKTIEANHTTHISYTDDEMQRLWADVNDTFVQLILIQCYSGWRPNELLDLRIENINTETWTFTGGMKTEAGKNRTVPIHSAIRNMVVQNINHARQIGSKYLFNTIDKRTGKATPVLYRKFSEGLSRLITERNLNPEHRLHDGRKQFVTLAKKYKVDEYAIKRIVGHAIDDLTERIYTDRDDEWLHEEIEKIKGPVGVV